MHSFEESLVANGAIYGRCALPAQHPEHLLWLRRHIAVCARIRFIKMKKCEYLLFNLALMRLQSHLITHNPSKHISIERRNRGREREALLYNKMVFHPFR